MATIKSVDRKYGTRAVRNLHERPVTTVVVSFSLTPQEVKLLPQRPSELRDAFGPAVRYERFIGVSTGSGELVASYRMDHLPFGTTDHTDVPDLALRRINAGFNKLRDQCEQQK